jgi:GNAT superfamily N-acetyltransferase
MRLAVASDAPAISALMEVSIRAIFPAYYNAEQVESSVKYVGHLDMQLIEDGTYFVHEAEGEIVACGGWSRRNKLFAGPGDAADDDRLLDPAAEPARVRAMFVRADWTRRGLGRAILDACEDAARSEGFSDLALGATLAGLPLYLAFGFEEVNRMQVAMPDGVELTVISMERPIRPQSD